MVDISEFITFEVQDDIALIGLNRPEKRNAISDRFVNALAAAAEKAEAEAKAVVLFGHGDHFCAGLDLAEHATKSAMQAIQGSRNWHTAFGKIEHSTIPWFSALHGAVVGGGLELAASTHVRVAGPGTFFGLPEGQRGIFVGGGGSVRVARLIGAARMADMMLTGRIATAEEGERWGLLQYLTDAGNAKDKAIELAKSTTGNAELSNYAVLNALPRIQDMSAEDGLFMESIMSAFASSTPEAAERLADFVQKRAKRLNIPGKS